MSDKVIARLTYGQLRGLLRRVMDNSEDGVFGLKDLMDHLNENSGEPIRVFNNNEAGDNEVLVWIGGDLSDV